MGTGTFYDINYKDRICPKCGQDIEDEFHYFMVCPFLNKERRKLPTKLLGEHPNMITFLNIMGIACVSVRVYVCLYVNIYVCLDVRVILFFQLFTYILYNTSGLPGVAQVYTISNQVLPLGR